MLQTFLLFLFLIFLNAAFASAEIAVISISDARLKNLADGGNKKAARLSALTAQPAKFLATIQVAITMAGFLQGATAADQFSEILVSFLVDSGIGIPEQILAPVCLFVITVVLAYFSLVFGELVPKRVAMKKPENLALGMSGILHVVSKVFAPLVWLLTLSTNGILRLIGIDPNEDDEMVTEEEIRMLLLEGQEQGVIPSEENEIIQNVFELDDQTVEEICTHRREVIGLSLKDTEEKWEETIYESRHTYYPVFGENKDDIVGILDTKDYFRMQEKGRNALLDHAVDKAWLIPESMKANLLFRQMKEKRSYFAVILDEYGGMSGIITLHDLMETLVGELEECEEPKHPKELEQIGENRWVIQGYADLEDVAKAIKHDFPVEEYDTFSGYVCGVIGRVPDDGESFACEDGNLSIHVKSVQRHMVEEAVVELYRETIDNERLQM